MVADENSPGRPAGSSCSCLLGGAMAGPTYGVCPRRYDMAYQAIDSASSSH
jgi:hypothetical protein